MLIKLFVLSLFLQVLFPFITMVLMFKKRVKAVKDKKVSFSYFKAYQGGEGLPESAVVYGRHYTNLFEMPMIFLIAGSIYLSLGQVDQISLGLAFFYLLIRFFHSIVHLNSNHVITRLNLFASSCLCLLVFWIYLVGKIFLSNSI